MSIEADELKAIQKSLINLKAIMDTPNNIEGTGETNPYYKIGYARAELVRLIHNIDYTLSNAKVS